MKLDLIHKYKDAFIEDAGMTFMREGKWMPGFKWDIIASWKDNFEIEAEFMGLKEALRSEESRVLWGGEKFSMKSGILDLYDYNPDFLRSSIKDVLNEEKDLNLRFSRFLFHCDEIQMELKSQDPRKNNHYQDDYAVSLYLSLEYPEQYGLFKYEEFEIFMQKIGSLDIPPAQDKERIFKIFRTLYKLIMKDAEFANNFQFLIKDRDYTGPSLYLINEIISFSLNA